MAHSLILPRTTYATVLTARVLCQACRGSLHFPWATRQQVAYPVVNLSYRRTIRRQRISAQEVLRLLEKVQMATALRLSHPRSKPSTAPASTYGGAVRLVSAECTMGRLGEKSGVNGRAIAVLTGL